jgi:bacillolysin
MLLTLAVATLALIPASMVSSPSGSGGSEPAAARGDATVRVSPAAQDALGALKNATAADVNAQASRETGHYSFVNAASGGVLVSDEREAPPAKRAIAFLAAHGGLVGMSGLERAALARGGAPPAGSDLQVDRTDTDGIGFTHVRLNQFYQGLRVFGAQVTVHMNGEGITGVNGKFVPHVAVSTIPSLTQGAAAEAALGLARKASGAADLRVENIETAIYPAGLLEGHAIRNVLAYAVEVKGSQLHDQMWIDAQTGTLLVRIPKRHSALNRVVYSPEYDPANPNMFVIHKEGDAVPPPTLLTPPTANLYHFAGQTYNLFASAFGRDSYDGAGITMRSVYLVNELCPNAYWNGQATNYCPEIDSDDVVAHEWGHAYTQFTHDLVYAYQSGALNESYSDIWGETVDLHNGFDAEGGANNLQPRPAGQRWQVGEDVQGLNQPAAGILRNMWDPTEYGNPDKVSSNIYHCDASDVGGVHANSGVPNHAFAMLVDGKQFNGKTVTGIGFTKAIHIYYRAMTVYQNPATNFADHEVAVKQSCQDLIGQPLNGFNAGAAPVPGATIAAADCQQVAIAMEAVEMSRPPPCNFGPLLNPAEPPICDGATPIFTEDWESGDDGWTRTSTGVFADWEDSSRPLRDFEVRSQLPGNRAGSAAWAKDPKIGDPGGGSCTPGQEGNGDYSGQYTIDSPEITIPQGATNMHIAFDHFVATEVTYDGGQLEISKNGGAFQLIPQNQYTFNAPNTTFAEPPPIGNNTNPNAGEFSWNGTNTGSQTGSWGTTVANISSIAKPGDKIKVRFTYSQDGCNGTSIGWFVDNIRVFNCPTLEAPVLSIGAGYENPDTNGSYQLSWTRPAGAVGPDTLEESTTACGPLVFDNAEAGLTKWNVTTEGAYAGFSWQTSDEKPMHESTTFRARGAEAVANASALLTYKTPIAIPASGTTRLSWRDWNVNEGDDVMSVEVSENGTTWTAVYTDQRSALAPEAAEFFGLESLFARQVDLTPYNGKTIQLRFKYFLGPENRAGSTPFGWYIDDITLQNETWSAVANTDGTSFNVVGRGTGTYCYRVRSRYVFGGVQAASPVSNVVSVTVAPGVAPAPPARLQNISARARIQTGDNLLFGGFIIRDAAKRVILRGIAPSMQSGGSAVPGRMSDPILELHQEGNPTPIAVNDDWQTNAADVQGTNLAPTDPRESAIVATLNPGSYTTIMYGKGGETGIGLVEIYDLDTTPASTLRNLSARAFVETNDNVLIGGFIAGPTGSGTTRVVVRAIGPSLQSQIPAALSDTTLEVVDANGNPTTNDDWQQSPNAAEIQQAGLAPTDARESAVLLPTLAAGPHTAIVRGKGNPNGVGVVEIYNVQ